MATSISKGIGVGLKKSARPKDNETMERRRRAVLDVAKKCFCRIGFHQTTIRDIAQEAGISVGHIYNSFAGKEDIIEAMAREQTQEFSKMLLEDTSGGKKDDLATVEAHFRRVVTKMFDTESAYLVVSFMNEALTNDRIYNVAVELMQNFREKVLEICKAERKGTRAELEAQVVFMLSVFQGLRFVMLFHPHVSRKVVTDVVVDRLMLLVKHDIEQSAVRDAGATAPSAQTDKEESTSETVAK